MSLVGSSARGQTISWHPARWPKCRTPYESTRHHPSLPPIARAILAIIRDPSSILPSAPCLRVLYVMRGLRASHPVPSRLRVGLGWACVPCCAVLCSNRSLSIYYHAQSWTRIPRAAVSLRYYLLRATTGYRQLPYFTHCQAPARLGGRVYLPMPGTLKPWYARVGLVSLCLHAADCGPYAASSPSLLQHGLSTY